MEGAPSPPADGARGQTLLEIHQDLLLKEGELQRQESKDRRKAEKKSKKQKKKHKKHKKHSKKHKKKHKKKHSSSSSDSSGSSSEGEGEDGAGENAPVQLSDFMKGSSRTADGSGERAEVRYSSVSGEVISLNRKMTAEDLWNEQQRQAKLANLNGDDESEAIKKNSKKKKKKSKETDGKSSMQRVADSLIENGKRAREELQGGNGGDYKKRLKNYKEAQNQGMSVDFAQMSKDRRYYASLKKAQAAAKTAEAYSAREASKMDALKAMYGLDRLNNPGAAAAAAAAAPPPLAMSIEERLLAKARERSKAA